MIFGILGMAVMTIGAAGIILSTAFEIKTKAKAYEIMMKVFPLIFAIGALMWTLL